MIKTIFEHDPMYLLAEGAYKKKQFIIRKPQKNLQGFWSKCDMIGFIDDLRGLLSEVQKFCENDMH